jgi:titin
MVSDKPSPPTGPAAVDWKSDGSMELRWNVPESDGGAAISQYIVERREVGKKSWKQVGTSTITSIEIRGLKKDSSYNFRVIAKNVVGCSAPFIIEETFTAATAVKLIPKGVPSAPNNVQVTILFISSFYVIKFWEDAKEK